MKKIAGLLTGLFLALILAVSAVPAYAVTNAPTRIINVVYDDSGSMIVNDAKQDVDTWCQAKYSMEVFAAMLGSHDTMNVYVMSDYYKTDAMVGPRLVLSGSDGSKTNVAKVHDMITNAVGTPFNTVRKAYSDLLAASADEKWLVILTDGAFEGVSDIDGFFAGKDSDISVMFLGMGADAQSIKAVPAQNIYCEKAETNSQILNKITEICTRIFNMNKLTVDVSSMSVSFDIPMSELIVFAQGEDVSIAGIKSPKGKSLSGSSPVSVKYSEVATTNKNYTYYKIDYGLQGELVTYSGEFDAGEYKLSASNATTIEVYYKPNVEIMAFLTDAAGNRVASTQGIESGDYSLEFGFVKAGTTEPVNESKLLGDISYSASMAYNGEGDGREYHSGDLVTLKEGSYSVDVSADFLKYNTVTSSLNFTVYTNRELEIETISAPVYEIDRTGFLNANEPIVLKATVEGREFTAQEWGSMGVPVITKQKGAEKRVDLKVEKTDKPGYYNVYPYLNEPKTSIGDYNSFGVNYSIESQQGLEKWSGATDGTVEIKDLRNWFWKHIDKVIKLSILLFVFLFLLGYFVKKKLPKKLAKYPKVDCTNKTGNKTSPPASGRFTKTPSSVLIPYRAERGVIRFLPNSASGSLPPLKVKAVGSNRMEVTNTMAYKNNKSISFDGKYIDDNVKKNLRTGAGLKIVVDGSAKVYSTKLNQSLKKKK